MNPAISITLLLLSTTVVKSWVSLEVQTGEGEDSSTQLNHDMRERAAHHTEKILQDKACPFCCTACKFIVSKVKKHLGKENTKAKIQGLLAKACNRVRFRSICKKLVRKYQDKLIDLLANKGTPRSICIRLRLCRRSCQ